MNILKRLFCKHDYRGRGFNYARCEKCDKLIWSPTIAKKAIDDYCSRAVSNGAWTKEEADQVEHKAILRQG